MGFGEDCFSTELAVGTLALDLSDRSEYCSCLVPLCPLVSKREVVQLREKYIIPTYM